MRAVFCFLVLVCFSCSAMAQQVYYVYFEADNGLPFYLKMDDKVMPATSGYLLLTNLKDSTYDFSIGFSSGRSESKFSIALGGRDRGFVIRSSDEGLGLKDLQSASLIRPQRDD